MLSLTSDAGQSRTAGSGGCSSQGKGGAGQHSFDILLTYMCAENGEVAQPRPLAQQAEREAKTQELAKLRKDAERAQKAADKAPST